MYKALIVDDESFVIQDLKGLLEMNCPEIKEIFSATNSDDALEAFQKVQPDVVFMDINIDRVSGLELVRQIDPALSQVIFVTAHNQFAIEAFKLSAVDYLLKPVDPEELMVAVKRAVERIEKNQIHAQLAALSYNLGRKGNHKKIVLTDMEGLHIIDIPEILWCHANGSYTEFVMKDGEKITVSKHLKTYERLLTEHGLIRVNRSFLINIYNISKIERSKGELRMKSGETVPISIAPDMLKEILQKLKE